MILIECQRKTIIRITNDDEAQLFKQALANLYLEVNRVGFKHNILTHNQQVIFNGVIERWALADENEKNE